MIVISNTRLVMQHACPFMQSTCQHPLYYLYVRVGHYYTYDLAELDSMSHILGRVDDAVRIQGVWANVPHIESVMVII